MKGSLARDVCAGPAAQVRAALERLHAADEALRAAAAAPAEQPDAGWASVLVGEERPGRGAGRCRHSTRSLSLKFLV